MKTRFAQSLPEDWEHFSQFFFALGDRTRQQIVLIFDPYEELCVSDIVRLFSLSRPAISHHLKILRNAGLLQSEKRGKEVYYRVNHAYCADVLRAVREFVSGCPQSETALPTWAHARYDLDAARVFDPD